MIQINLLGGPRPRKGYRAASALPEVTSTSVHPVLVMLLVGVLALAGNGLYYVRLTHERDRIDRDMKSAELENRRLSQVKTSYLEAEKEKEAYKKRVDVIEQLRANQSGPVNLLTTVGDTVNGTDAVWLNTLTEEGNNINIEGMALTPSAVANLMRNLQKTGYFKSVEIKETFQDDTYKEVQAFQFTLTCEKAQQRT